MHNITLVSTRHDTLGRCNSGELYQIIERINPQVIFEEIPPTLFDDYYLKKSRSNLESDTINKYLVNHKTKQIPIDSDNYPSEEFFKDYENLIKRIEGLADINGFTFRKRIDTNKAYTNQYGFQYLNSKNCSIINNEIIEAISNGLQKLNDEKLFQTFKLWNEIHEKRENHMLQNIYNYSKKHSYERALFTIGSAHRNSIIEKISVFNKYETVRLNWIF